MANTYKVFISHSWDHVEDLKNLRNLLTSRGYFNVEFTEIPPMEPINSTNSYYVKARLKDKISTSNIVLGIAGVYATYSDWMEWEMNTAKEFGLNVIGVIPRGQERISKTVQNCSIDTVRWNTESIVEAIRKYSK